jgi:peptidoglycan/xylan/chitin deacetylase (PgdA/CDA1 family)
MKRARIALLALACCGRRSPPAPSPPESGAMSASASIASIASIASATSDAPPLADVLPERPRACLTAGSTAQLPRLFFRADGAPSRVAITLDDAIDPTLVQRVLDLARETRTCLTIFPSGIAVAKNPALFRRAIEDGHELGSHGNYHQRLTDLPPAMIESELDRAQAAIDAANGAPYPLRMLRPPDGAGGYDGGDPKLMRIAEKRGLSIVMWDVGPFEQPTDAVRTKVLANASAGSIVLLHFVPNDVAALPSIIAGLRQKGLALVTVSGLFSP